MGLSAAFVIKTNINRSQLVECLSRLDWLCVKQCDGGRISFTQIDLWPFSTPLDWRGTIWIWGLVTVTNPDKLDFMSTKIWLQIRIKRDILYQSDRMKFKQLICSTFNFLWCHFLFLFFGVIVTFRIWFSWLVTCLFIAQSSLELGTTLKGKKVFKNG